MLMNENSELRSFVSCSKNFSKNIINKSIKNNIVLINNDGGVKSKRKHRGVHTQYLRRHTLSYKFLYIYIFSLIVTYILFCILMYILSLILFIIIIYILFFIVTYIFSISSNHISTKIFGISFSFGVTVTCIKFSLYIKKFILISSPIIRKILIIIYILFTIVICIVLFISYLVVPYSLIRILIQISSNTPINISFSSSFISFIYISFISFIIFTSFTDLFISDNTIITIWALLPILTLLPLLLYSHPVKDRAMTCS